MSQHPEVVNETVKTLLEIGTGSGGTRNISGTSSFHTSLEKKLANLHNKENALLFSSAYTANQSTLWTLGKKIKNLEIFSDELNHASLIQGIKNSGASCHIFQHNDVGHLETLLQTVDPRHPKLIVFESSQKQLVLDDEDLPFVKEFQDDLHHYAEKYDMKRHYF